MELLGRDVFSLILPKLFANDHAHLARVSKKMDLLIQRYRRDECRSLTCNKHGPAAFRLLFAVPLAHFRHLTSLHLNLLSASESIESLSSISSFVDATPVLPLVKTLVISQHYHFKPSTSDSESFESDAIADFDAALHMPLHLLLRRFTGLKWLEIDSMKNPRDEFVSCHKDPAVSAIFAGIEVVVVGHYRAETFSHHNYVMFRGFEYPSAVKRVLEKQEKELERTDSAQSRMRIRTVLTLYERLLNPDCEIARECYGESATLIDKQTREHKCANAYGAHPGDHPSCFIWINCYTCSMVGGYGLCFHCANSCHRGHSIMFQYVSTGAWCDCTSCQ